MCTASGLIPTEFGELSSLRCLNLGVNKLNGTHLLLLFLVGERQRAFNDNNTSSFVLAGSIPTEFGELTGIESVCLENNQLTGTVRPVARLLMCALVGKATTCF
jgi:hypothetical protein